MSSQFKIPRNLILTILTDFTWINSLILIESIICGRLDVIKDAVAKASKEYEKATGAQARESGMRRDYMKELNSLQERVRFPAGQDPNSEARSAKAAFDSKMAELCGGDEIALHSDSRWANLSDADKEFFDAMMQNKVRRRG